MNSLQVEQAQANPVREKRQWPRKKMAVQAELRPHESGPIRVNTADLSLGGCYVEMMFTLPVGKELEIVLWLGLAKVCTRATVVTSHPQFGNGFKFTGMDEGDHDLLATFLEAESEDLEAKSEEGAS